MIKLDGVPIIEHLTPTGIKTVKANLIADTSIEVEDIGTDGSSVSGLCKGDKLAMGSTCFTVEMEFGILDSTGNWHFQ